MGALIEVNINKIKLNKNISNEMTLWYPRNASLMFETLQKKITS